MQHIVGKLLTRATTLLQTSSQLEVCTQNYGAPKLQESQLWQFRDSSLPFGSPGTKFPLDVGLVGGHKVYYKGEGDGFPQVWAVVSLVSPSLPVVHLNTKSLQLCTNHLVFGFVQVRASSWCLSLFLVPSQSSNMPFYPQNVATQKTCPGSFVTTPLWASVRMRLTLPKVGTWSPPGLPQLQSSTEDGKTTRLEVLFILLERPWSLDVENGLAWAIWTSAAQVMVERRVESQTGSLTPEHKKSGIDLTPMWHTIGKLLKKATRLLQTSSQFEVWAGSYELPKSWDFKLGPVSGLPLGSRSPENKSHLDAGATEQRRQYYMGEGGGFPWVRAVVSQMSPRSPVACPNTKRVQNEF